MLVSTRTGMKLENTFEVPAPPEQAWELLMDVPRVIPCMPGAELTEAVDDSTWKAKMTVKLGPMSFEFATDVKREEADVDAQRAKLSARARELRGRGGGQATIESSLTQVDGGTRVHIVTDMSLSGAVAQYGRGMVEDVAGQLVGRFADCLRTQLVPAAAEVGAVPEPAAAPAPATPVAGVPLILGALRRAIARFFKRRKS
jgi:carbon monoxide dehydrogenase subunit G